MATLTSPIAIVPDSDRAGRTVLVYTSNGVETGVTISKPDLDRLALWLCRTDEYCCRLSYSNTLGEDAQIEREIRANGGYCDRCKDHAGKLLSEFFVIAREAE